jgi:transcriptional regulator PpsR
MTMTTPSAATTLFRRADRSLAAIAPDVASRVVAAASDIALVVDRTGVVRDLSVNSPDLSDNGFEGWVNQPWIDAVTDDSRTKIADMLRDAASGSAPRWREVNHPAEDGGSVLIRYFAIDSGVDGEVIVVGRDLRSSAALQQRLVQVQQSVERDYLKLRQSESRYRLLFQMSSEAVLIVDSVTRRVAEANPSALRLTELAETAISGRPFSALLDPASVDRAMQVLNVAHGTSAPTPAQVRLAAGVDCEMAASLFRQEQSSRFLVRLSPKHGAVASEPAAQLNAVLERISDGFVVTDPDLRILTVNPGFLDLAQLATREQVKDESLDRYLGRPHVDTKIVLAQLREHGALRNFATVLRGRYGAIEEVEVSAVAALDADPPCFGFTIRGVSRRLQGKVTPVGEAPRSVEQLTQLIGRVPMKDIVRESTDLIERLCIEAALTLTSNNRASAADMLGSVARASIPSCIGTASPTRTRPPIRPEGLTRAGS